MKDREHPTPQKFEIPPALKDIEIVSRLASEIAYQHSLNRQSYEELTKFAQVHLRLRQLDKLFAADQNLALIDYVFYTPRRRKQQKITLKRKDFKIFQSALSWSAFCMFDNLSANSNSAAAVREVKLIIDDVYPQNL